MAPKRKAVRDGLLGRISHYTNTKSVGLRDPITGQIAKRVSKQKAENRGPVVRLYTVADAADDLSKKKKKKSPWSPF